LQHWQGLVGARSLLDHGLVGGLLYAGRIDVTG